MEEVSRWTAQGELQRTGNCGGRIMPQLEKAREGEEKLLKKKKKKDRKKKSKGKLTEPLHGKSTYKAAAEVYAYVYLTVHRSPDLKYFGMRLQFGEF